MSASNNLQMLLVLVLVCAIWESSSLELPPRATKSRPFAQNILLIISDDLKPNLGSYGDPYSSTPNIDRLAARGVRFSRAYAQYANCGPSRASFLTSMRPDTLGVYDNNTPLRKRRSDALTMPQIFRFSGYRVLGMGKIGDGRVFGQDEFYTDPNYPAFDIPLAFNQNSTHCFEVKRPVCTRKGWSAKQCKCMVSPGVRNPVSEVVVPAIQQFPQLLDTDFIDENMGTHGAAVLEGLLADKDPNPFLLIVGLTKPHLPYAAPQKYFALFNESVDVPLAAYRVAPKGPNNPYSLKVMNEVTGEYTGANLASVNGQKAVIRANYACISFVDRQVGKLMDVVDRSISAKRDNLLIVMTSDHGFHLGELGHWGKHTVFDHGTKIPLIIAPPMFSHPVTYSSGWRASQMAGRVVRTPVELVDLVPTLMDLVGLFDSSSFGSNNRRLATEDQQKTSLQTTAGEGPRRSLAAAVESVRRQGLGQTQGKSVRQLILNDEQFRQTHSALACSMYVRNGIRGYAIRTERYRYVQWFAKTGNIRTIRALVEELYDFTVDPMESNNIVESSKDVRQRLRKLFVEFVSTGNVVFTRESDDDADEDAAIIRQRLPDPAFPSQLGYFQEWVASLETRFNPSNACKDSPFVNCFPVQHMVSLPAASATLISAMASGSVSLPLAIKLALGSLFDQLGPSRSGASSSSLRVLQQQQPTMGDISVQEVVLQDKKIRFQLDLPSMEAANWVIAAIRDNSVYFDFLLDEAVSGAIADAGLGLDSKPEPIKSELGSGFPKLVMATAPTVPPTPPPFTFSPSASSSPTSSEFTHSPTTPTTTTTTSSPTDSIGTSSPTSGNGEGPDPTSSPASPPAITPSPTTTRPTPSSPVPSSPSTLSPGAIAGIATGSILALLALLCAIPFFCFGWDPRRKRRLPDATAVAQPTAATEQRDQRKTGGSSPSSIGDAAGSKDTRHLAIDDDENEATVVGEDEDTTYVHI